MEAISSAKTAPGESIPMIETMREANDDIGKPTGGQDGPTAKKRSHGRKGCGKGIRRAFSRCRDNTRPSCLAMAAIWVRLTLVAHTIYCLGKVLVKFLASSSDIGTDVLQGKSSSNLSQTFQLKTLEK